MADYASELLGGNAGATSAAPAEDPHDYAKDLLTAQTTPGGAVTSISGRAQMGPRQAGRDGYKLDDLMNQVMNKDSSGGPTVADYSTLFKAAMVDDPDTKLRIFAKARFPDDPNARERYALLGNEVVYVNKDGKLYRDTPAGFSGGLQEFSANIGGKALPIVGGIVGGSVGAVAGPPGVIGGAAAGAAAGEGYRKTIANVAFDEPQTVGGNIKAMATEAAWSGAGAYGGKLFTDWLGRKAARDIGRLNRPAAANLEAKARAQGVDLTPGQITNLPSLKLREEALARMPASADIMEEGMKRQAEQATRATERFLARVSPVEGLDEAGAMARDAAKQVIAKLTVERSNAARPLYQQAFSQFAGFTDEQGAALARLRTSPSFKEAERISTRLLQDDLAIIGQREMPQAGALRDLHYTKLALDKMIGDDARGGFAKTTRSALVGIKNQLLNIMDEASPAYSQARSTFAHLSPNIESVKDGVISRVAGLGDEQAMNAAKTMLGPHMSPTAVGRARELFVKSGLLDDWDAMVRSHLQESFMKAGREFKSGAGGSVGQAPSFRAAMIGNPAQKRVLEAAMDPAQRRAFDSMMEVFEAMGRIRPANVNSMTQPMQEATRAIYRDSGAGVIGRGAQILSPQDIGTRVSAWLAEARAGQHAEKLAQIVTSPEGMRNLKALAQVDPSTQRFLIQASGTFGISIAPSKTDVQKQ